MTPRTQAAIFIETLEEMRDSDRESRKARLRLELKARVRRFVEEFQTDALRNRPPFVWSRRMGLREDRR